MVMPYKAKRDTSRAPAHPGALLREDILPAIQRPEREIAELLKISRRHLHAILSEKKPISPAIAVRLGKLFGNGAGIWVRMQAEVDVWRAAQSEDVSRIPTIKAA
jgi:addiction module HigA family antidote